jgi:GH15 family glucan-1,4-alpha-glucosidase
MANRIEDYAIIGNCETCALVGRDGSIDWLCLPRFDSASCFSALLGEPRHGRWLIEPADKPARVTRRYRDGGMVLETDFEVDGGAVRIIDFVARRPRATDVFRLVRGLRGKVPMRIEIVVRFDYGSIIPWVSRQEDGRLQFTAGPDRLLLDSPPPLRGADWKTIGEFEVAPGEEVPFELTWSRSYHEAPSRLDASQALRDTEKFWVEWTRPWKRPVEWAEATLRSLVTLKALAHWETGGIVAAATTSLPEKIGGARNWDYRFCWLRDATFTLYALVGAGFLEEAKAWRSWLIRAAAGNPADLQIMYGIGGERRLTEYEIDWLPGYEKSAPVRVGNAASGQLQLDVYGEVIDALYVARRAGLAADEASWDLECALIEHLEAIWTQPDQGIWEVRGPPRHFTHSKVMSWVAFDRMVRSVEEFGLAGPVDRWRAVRDQIHRDVCKRGFDGGRGSFVQYYGADALDASLLLIPIVGFLPIDDQRVIGTVAAIERDLLREGFVFRYRTEKGTDGLAPGEGVFLACSAWLADVYVLQGRYAEARTLFERLLALRNDLGLIAEEYDPAEKRQLGNFPQALSHLSLVNTARNLLSAAGPAKQRASGAATPVAADDAK